MDIETEDALLILSPIIVYWVYSGMYTVLGSWRTDMKEDNDDEGMKKNLVTRRRAVTTVLALQAIQIVLGYFMHQTILRNHVKVMKTIHGTPISNTARFFVAMVMFDTWQYFLHRFMHANKFMYKHVHSWHHELIAPFAMASLYTHPVEFIVVDTLGPVMSIVFSGLPLAPAIMFLCLASMRVVDDHCRIHMPLNPLQAIFKANSLCHYIHHQRYGYKFNFSSPFFVVWDKIMGTYIPCKLEKRN